jgi:hypothetical protein
MGQGTLRFVGLQEGRLPNGVPLLEPVAVRWFLRILVFGWFGACSGT